jgi:hypothetical protein
LGLTTRSDLWWGNSSSFDPVKVQIWGSNDGETFVAVTPDPIALTAPTTRATDYNNVVFENDTAYRYYQVRVNTSGDYRSILSEIRLFAANSFEQNMRYVMDKQAVLVEAGIDQVLFDMEPSSLIRVLGTDLTLLKGSNNGLTAVVDVSGLLKDAQAHGASGTVDLSVFSRDAQGLALGMKASALMGADQTLSLKDALRLKLDAITIDAAMTALTIHDGTGLMAALNVLPLIGDNNLDGVISAAENAAVRVRYDIGSSSGSMSRALLTSLTEMRDIGIDAVQLKGRLQDATDTLPVGAFQLINTTPSDDWGSQGGLPWHAFDGNVNSRAAIQQSNNLSDPRGLRVDLGQAKTLLGVGLTTGNNWNWNDTSSDPTRVTILSSVDGLTYTEVTSREMPVQYDRASDYPDIMFDQAVSARFVKVQLYNASSNLTTLSEVRLYEAAKAFLFDLGQPNAALTTLPRVGDDNGDGLVSATEDAAYDISVRLNQEVQLTRGLPAEAFYGASYDDWGSTNGGAPKYAFDNLTSTKALFRGGNGDIANVTPLTIDLGAPKLVTALALTTVDAQNWGTGTQADPTRYELWGSSDGHVFAKLGAGALMPPSQRETSFPEVEFSHSTAYRYYQLKLAGSSDYWAAVSEIQLKGSPLVAGIQGNTALIEAMRQAGIDHLTLDYEAADGYFLGSAQEWTSSGLDLVVQLNSWQSKAVPGVSLPQPYDLAAVVDGLNQTSAEFLSVEGFHDRAYWASKVAQVQSDGLNSLVIGADAGVHLNETLAQALLDAGMLKVSAASTLMVDIPGPQKLMALSLDGMSALGIDQVNSSNDVWVRLGQDKASAQVLKDILSGFFDETAQAFKHVFGEKGADLWMDPDSFASLLADAQSEQPELVRDLIALGITQVDVVPATGDAIKSYALNAETALPVEVTVLGTHAMDMMQALEQDLLQTK